ncbi:diphthine--ammonia ligase [Chloroflexota bacterium]
MKNKVFASWSGGKDGCLACYRALNSGLEVSYLINMVTEDGTRSSSHGVSTEVLRVQAKAIGIPVLQRKTTRGTYETEYKSAIRSVKRKGISGGVFGDIDFNAHREWIEKLCKDTDIAPHLPLWEESQDKLIREFINAGFVSIVVAAKSDLFSQDILGKVVDVDFINYLEGMRKTKDITLCGEAGEYHTLVVDGPLFRERLKIVEAEKVLRDGSWFLDIKRCDLLSK